MGETELLTIITEGHAHIAGLFGQVISINLAMIVGIYYFLRRGSLGLRLFAYLVYLIGMFLFLGLLLIESNVLVGALESLRDLSFESLSRPTQRLLAVSDSWLGTASRAVSNIAFWVLLIGVTYLLFFWKGRSDSPGEHQIRDKAMEHFE
jgi:hypothetical protein